MVQYTTKQEHEIARVVELSAFTTGLFRVAQPGSLNTTPAGGESNI
jgi:hypothetical protein